MKSLLTILFICITHIAFSQKSVFNGTWYTKAPDPVTGKGFAVSLKVKGNIIIKGEVASLSMRDGKGENGKVQEGIMNGDTVKITYSTKDGGIHKGSLIYNEQEKAVYWKLLSSEKGTTLAPDELKLDSKHY